MNDLVCTSGCSTSILSHYIVDVSFKSAVILEMIFESNGNKAPTRYMYSQSNILDNSVCSVVAKSSTHRLRLVYRQLDSVRTADRYHRRRHYLHCLRLRFPQLSHLQALHSNQQKCRQLKGLTVAG